MATLRDPSIVNRHNNDQHVRVAVRVRPLNRHEISRGAATCIGVVGNTLTLVDPVSLELTAQQGETIASLAAGGGVGGHGALPIPRRNFAYDHVYHRSGQERIYSDIGARVLEHAWAGYNACVFAYGQTGSGKSYTMLGPPAPAHGSSLQQPPTAATTTGGDDQMVAGVLDPGAIGTDIGLIPRICCALFDRIGRAEEDEAKAVGEWIAKRQAKLASGVGASDKAGGRLPRSLNASFDDAGENNNNIDGNANGKKTKHLQFQDQVDVQDAPSDDDDEAGAPSSAGSTHRTFAITVSYLEIHCERVRDLFALEDAAAVLPPSGGVASPGTAGHPSNNRDWDATSVGTAGTRGSSGRALTRKQVDAGVGRPGAARGASASGRGAGTGSAASSTGASAAAASSHGNLRVREHPSRGAYVEGLREVKVTSYADVEKLLVAGSVMRTVAETRMNETSSRSHALFTLNFTQTTVDTATGVPLNAKTSKLVLVDLAGSERSDAFTGRVTRPSALDTLSPRHAQQQEAQRHREMTKINTSLSALGAVIKALSSGPAAHGGNGAGSFVPYRNSVLTWLLRDCLGGNSRTSMIATVSPADNSYAETLSTLKYCEFVKKIVTSASVNEGLSQDGVGKLIAELRAEVAMLRSALAAEQSNRSDGGGGLVPRHLRTPATTASGLPSVASPGAGIGGMLLFGGGDGLLPIMPGTSMRAWGQEGAVAAGTASGDAASKSDAVDPASADGIFAMANDAMSRSGIRPVSLSVAALAQIRAREALQQLQSRSMQFPDAAESGQWGIGSSSGSAAGGISSPAGAAQRASTRTPGPLSTAMLMASPNASGAIGQAVQMTPAGRLGASAMAFASSIYNGNTAASMAGDGLVRLQAELRHRERLIRQLTRAAASTVKKARPNVDAAVVVSSASGHENAGSDQAVPKQHHDPFGTQSPQAAAAGRAAASASSPLPAVAASRMQADALQSPPPSAAPRQLALSHPPPGRSIADRVSHQLAAISHTPSPAPANRAVPSPDRGNGLVLTPQQLALLHDEEEAMIDAQEDARRSRQEAESLREEVSQSRAEADHLRAQLHDANERISSLESEVATNATAYADANSHRDSRISNVRTELQRLMGAHSAAVAENEGLRSQLEAAQLQCARWQSEAEQVKQELSQQSAAASESASASNAGHSEQLKSKDAAISTMRSRIDTLTTALSQAEARAASAENARQSMRNELDAAEGAIGAAESAMEDMQKQLDDANAAAAQARSELARALLAAEAARNEAQALKSDVALFKGQLALAHGDAAAGHAKISEVQSTLQAQLMSAQKELTEAKQALVSEKNASSSTMLASESQLKAAQGQVAMLLKQIDELRASSTMAAADVIAANAAASAAESRASNAEARVSDLQQHNENLKLMLQQADDNVRAEGARADAAERAAVLHADAVDERMASMQVQLETAKKEMASARSAAERAMREATASVATQVAALRKGGSEARSQLEKVRQECAAALVRAETAETSEAMRRLNVDQADERTRAAQTAAAAASEQATKWRLEAESARTEESRARLEAASALKQASMSASEAVAARDELSAAIAARDDALKRLQNQLSILEQLEYQLDSEAGARAEAEGRSASLASALAQAMQRAAELEGDVEQLQGKLQQQREEGDASLTLLRTDLASLRTQNGDHVSRIAELQQQLQEVHNIATELDSQVSSLQQQLDDEGSAHAADREEFEARLKQQQEEASQEVIALQQQRAQEVERIQVSNVPQVQALKDQHEQQLAQAHRDFEDALQQQLRQTQEDFEAQVSSLQAEQEDELASLREQLRSHQSAWEAERSILGEERSLWEADLRAMREQLANAQHLESDARSRAETAEQQALRAVSVAESAAAELASARQMASDMVQVANRKCEEATIDADSLRSQLTKAHNQHKLLQEKYLQLQSDLITSREAAASARFEASEAKDRAASLQEELRNEQLRCEQLASRSEQLSESLTSLQSAVEENLHELLGSRSSIQSMQLTLDSERRSWADHQSALEAQLAASQRRVAKMKKQLMELAQHAQGTLSATRVGEKVERGKVAMTAIAAEMALLQDSSAQLTAAAGGHRGVQAADRSSQQGASGSWDAHPDPVTPSESPVPPPPPSPPELHGAPTNVASPAPRTEGVVSPAPVQAASSSSSRAARLNASFEAQLAGQGVTSTVTPSASKSISNPNTLSSEIQQQVFVPGKKPGSKRAPPPPPSLPPPIVAAIESSEVIDGILARSSVPSAVSTAAHEAGTASQSTSPRLAYSQPDSVPPSPPPPPPAPEDMDHDADRQTPSMAVPAVSADDGEGHASTGLLVAIIGSDGRLSPLPPQETDAAESFSALASDTPGAVAPTAATLAHQPATPPRAHTSDDSLLLTPPASSSDGQNDADGAATPPVNMQVERRGASTHDEGGIQAVLLGPSTTAAPSAAASGLPVVSTITTPAPSQTPTAASTGLPPRPPSSTSRSGSIAIVDHATATPRASGPAATDATADAENGISASTAPRSRSESAHSHRSHRSHRSDRSADSKGSRTSTSSVSKRSIAALHAEMDRIRRANADALAQAAAALAAAGLPVPDVIANAMLRSPAAAADAAAFHAAASTGAGASGGASSAGSTPGAGSGTVTPALTSPDPSAAAMMMMSPSADGTGVGGVMLSPGGSTVDPAVAVLQSQLERLNEVSERLRQRTSRAEASGREVLSTLLEERVGGVQSQTSQPQGGASASVAVNRSLDLSAIEGAGAASASFTSAVASPQQSLLTSPAPGRHRAHVPLHTFAGYRSPIRPVRAPVPISATLLNPLSPEEVQATEAAAAAAAGGGTAAGGSLTTAPVADSDAPAAPVVIPRSTRAMAIGRGRGRGRAAVAQAAAVAREERRRRLLARRNRGSDDDDDDDDSDGGTNRSGTGGSRVRTRNPAEATGTESAAPSEPESQGRDANTLAMMGDGYESDPILSDGEVDIDDDDNGDGDVASAAVSQASTAPPSHFDGATSVFAGVSEPATPVVASSAPAELPSSASGASASTATTAAAAAAPSNRQRRLVSGQHGHGPSSALRAISLAAREEARRAAEATQAIAVSTLNASVVSASTPAAGAGAGGWSASPSNSTSATPAVHITIVPPLPPLASNGAAIDESGGPQIGDAVARALVMDDDAASLD